MQESLPSGGTAPWGPGQGAGAKTQDTHTLAEFTDEECPQGGLFMVVLDVHVDDMHWLAGLLLSGIQIWPGQNVRCQNLRSRAQKGQCLPCSTAPFLFREHN